MSSEPIQFSREIVAAQLAMRASLRRGSAAIALFLVAWALALLALSQLSLSDSLWLVAFFVPLSLAFLAVRQLQWSVLSSHQLRCPSCRHLLVAERRWWNSPGSFCKACGKLAILPVWALKRAAAT